MRLKKILTAVLAVTALCTVALGAGLFSAFGDGTAYDGFNVDGASIRNSNPTGLRFETSVPETLRNQEGYSFGTLIIPASILGDAELVKTTDKVLDVKANKWAENENRFFAVLVGNGLTDFPESKYNEQIVARSYAENADGEVVYYTDEITRSVAKVASEALAKGGFTEDDEQFLIGVVDGVIGEELKFDSSLVTVEKNAAYNLYDLFKTNNGNKGLTAVWQISEGADFCTLDGDTLTVTSDGVIAVKATIGSKTATAIINDVAPAMPQNLVLDTDTATLRWDACENAASYEVKVTCWNSNSIVYSETVAENSVRISEDGLCGVYTAEVTAKSAHGATSETAVLKDAATYDNPDFNVYDETTGRKTLFRFTDEAALALVKQNTWKKGNNIATPLAEEMTITDGCLNVKGVHTNSGVMMRLNEPIALADIKTVSVKLNPSNWYFYVVLSDGVNSVEKMITADDSNVNGTGINKESLFTITNSMFTNTESTEKPEYIKYIHVTTYTVDNNFKISEVSYTALPAGFNEQNADGSYTLADFKNVEYKGFVSGTSSVTYSFETDGLKASFPGGWNDYLTYKMPEQLSLADMKTITINCNIQNNDKDYTGFYLVDSNGTKFYAKTGSYYSFANNKFTIDVAALIADGKISGNLVSILIIGGGYKSTNTYSSITYTKNA